MVVEDRFEEALAVRGAVQAPPDRVDRRGGKGSRDHRDRLGGLRRVRDAALAANQAEHGGHRLDRCFCPEPVDRLAHDGSGPADGLAHHERSRASDVGRRRAGWYVTALGHGDAKIGHTPAVWPRGQGPVEIAQERFLESFDGRVDVQGQR